MKERRPNHKLTEEEKKEVVKEYQGGLSSCKLAGKFNVSALMVIRLLKRNGIPRRSFDLAGRKYNVFDEAFEDLSGEESQYWAGFLDADGCVLESGKSYKITVGLQKGDYGHLVKLRQFLKSDVPIHQHENSYGLTVASKQIGNRLIDLGITPRKSYKNNKIDDVLAYSRHFWRGMIDGDGSLGINRKGASFFSLCGSRALIVQFADYVKSIGGPRNKVGEKGNIYQIAFGCNTAKFLAKHFYENATIYLDRKKKVVEKIISNP